MRPLLLGAVLPALLAAADVLTLEECEANSFLQIAAAGRPALLPGATYNKAVLALSPRPWWLLLLELPPVVSGHAPPDQQSHPDSQEAWLRAHPEMKDYFETVSRASYGMPTLPLPDWEKEREAYIRQRSLLGSGAILLFCIFIGMQRQSVLPGEEEHEEQQKSFAEQAATFTKDLPKISMKQMAEHTQAADLWIAINSVVCDVTDFLTVHPGGAELLLQHAGQESGEIFHEVGHSKFAVSLVRTRAVGLLESDQSPVGAQQSPGSPNIPAAVEPDHTPSLLGRLFTKEDRFHLHKVLGVTVLGQFFYRLGIAVSGCRIEGLDTIWLGPDWRSLALVWLSAVLQLSSFIFHVPRNRILGAPMIWQEWRMHNLIFVMRHVSGATIAWYAWRNQAHGAVRSWLNIFMFAAVIGQLWTVDVATHYLREDRHESLTATWPFWKGCPYWTERFLKFYYTIAQIQATSLMFGDMTQLLAFYLVIFPFQWASVLMTFVRKGIVTTCFYHVAYLWSLLQVVWVIFAPSTLMGLAQVSVFWLIIYCLRWVGLSKYFVWGAVMATSILPDFFPEYWGALPPYIQRHFHWFFWGATGLCQFLLTRQGLETRTRRYLESRPKPLVLHSRQKINENLYWLQFSLPAGFTSGLNPGQHVRVHCPNPSRDRETWNGKPNPESMAPVLSRSYTPVGAPDRSSLDLLVRYYPVNASIGFPEGGRASKYLIEEVRVGEQVPVSGPHGHKVYSGHGLFLVGNRLVKVQHCVALAGGSGITPLLAVLRELRAEARESSNKKGGAIQDLSVLHVTQQASEALPQEWYEPKEEQGFGPPCKVTQWTTGNSKPVNGAGGARSDRAAALTAQVKANFPEANRDVVVILCGPRGFVNDLCLPVMRSLGYLHIITLW